MIWQSGQRIRDQGDQAGCEIKVKACGVGANDDCLDIIPLNDPSILHTLFSSGRGTSAKPNGFTHF